MSNDFVNSIGFYTLKVRSLEKKALEVGVLEKSDIKTLADMRLEAWECYLVAKSEHLECLINDKLSEGV